MSMLASYCYEMQVALCWLLASSSTQISFFESDFTTNQDQKVLRMTEASIGTP